MRWRPPRVAAVKAVSQLIGPPSRLRVAPTAAAWNRRRCCESSHRRLQRDTSGREPALDMASSPPREFAPLGEGVPSSSGRVLAGVVFDVDGTLCKPQTYMFAEMRAALGIDRSTDILEHVAGLPTAAAQQTAMEAIRAIERRAMAGQVAQPGLQALMDYLARKGVPKAICTRNFDQPVAHLLATFLAGHVFDPIVTREFRPPKPHPAGILHIARSWGLTREPVAPGKEEEDREEEEEEEALRDADASRLIMVGDSIDDMTAGHAAGAATVLLVNDVNAHLAEHAHTDLVIERLDELIDILDRGFRGRAMPEAGVAEEPPESTI